MLRSPTQSKPPIDVKSDLLEEFYKQFYAENAGKSISISDIEDFEKNAHAEGKDKKQINIAKMILYADVVSSRKPSRAGEQITFFSGPLIGMFADAEKKDADPTFKAAADKIRKDQHVQSTILRIHSNSLNELASKMQYYHNHFSKMSKDFKANKSKILKENPALAENNNKMYKKTEKALEDLAKIYDDKMKSLKKEERILYDKILKKEPLTTKEYADGLELMTKLANFESKNVAPLVEAMSIYQALVSVDAFKSSKTKTPSQLQMNVYSELFQAPMRHPMMMEQVIKDAKKIQISTNSGSTKAIPDQVITDVSSQFSATQKVVSDSNFNFGNNFMVDIPTAKKLITLNNLLLADSDNKFGVDPETKALIANYANAIKKFTDANYQYYIDPSNINKQKFGMAYINLNTLFAQVSRPENVAKLEALGTIDDLYVAFYKDTSKMIKDEIPRFIEETKNGLHVFLRSNDFSNFKTKNIIELKVESQHIKDAIPEPKDKIIKDLLEKLDKQIESLDVEVNEDNSSKMEWVEKLSKAMETLKEIKSETQKLKQEKTEKLTEDSPLPSPVQPEKKQDSRPSTEAPETVRTRKHREHKLRAHRKHRESGESRKHRGESHKHRESRKSGEEHKSREASEISSELISKPSVKPPLKFIEIPKLNMAKLHQFEHEQSEAQREEAHLETPNNHGRNEDLKDVIVTPEEGHDNDVDVDEGHELEHQEEEKPIEVQNPPVSPPVQPPQSVTQQSKTQAKVAKEEEKHIEVQKLPITSQEVSKPVAPQGRIQARIAMFELLASREAEQAAREKDRKTPTHPQSITKDVPTDDAKSKTIKSLK